MDSLRSGHEQDGLHAPRLKKLLGEKHFCLGDGLLGVCFL